MKTAAGRAAPSHLPGGCLGSCPGGRSEPSAGTLSSPAGAKLGFTGGKLVDLCPKKATGKIKLSPCVQG